MPLILLTPLFPIKLLPILLGNIILFKDISFQFQRMPLVYTGPLDIGLVFKLIADKTENPSVYKISFQQFREVTIELGYNQETNKIIWLNINGNQEIRIRRLGVAQAAFQQYMLYGISIVDFQLKSKYYKSNL